MRVLITGAAGQLGQALLVAAPVYAQVLGLNRQQLDITQSASIKQYIADFLPDIVINAAAYTNVDQAELQPKLAFAVNTQGTENLALACAYHSNIKLIHLSTDYVFDGTASQPMTANTKPNPINEYGKSKLAGELAIQRTLPKNSVIVRTSGLYSRAPNSQNFYQTMKRLMLAGKSIKVVDDQITVPTDAAWLAQWLWQLVASIQNQCINGVLHAVNGQAVSWYEFAGAIQQKLLEKGELKQPLDIQPISTAEYIKMQNRVVAARPSYSVLKNSWY